MIQIILCACFLLSAGFFSDLWADDGYELWLKYKKVNNSHILAEYKHLISSIAVKGQSETCRITRDELSRGTAGLLDKKIPLIETKFENGSILVSTVQNTAAIKKSINTAVLDTLGREGFILISAKVSGKSVILITANDDIGLLYGAFHLLRLMQTNAGLRNLNVTSKPKIQLRLLNHWDNLDGVVERGYAGKSLWKWDELPDRIDPRYADYARANASLGINGTVPNNVNANPKILTTEYLKKVTVLADIFRPYGIRMFLSINFSSPVSSEFEINGNRRGGIGDLNTSDPFDPEVRAWWKNKVKEIYTFIPDFGGFLVKANSEGMPGPQEYGRNHADGANMLAEALAPYNGIVMWRAFVYTPETDPDRAKRAYKDFVPLDGKFHPNVMIQAKNGPIDFQPREPVQPLFGAMPKTPLLLELQITQEYLGHSTHLVYLAPMWKEYFQFDLYVKGKGTTLAKIIDGSVFPYRYTGITGVTNIGDDRNWCGHLFAQANWYSYGRLAWNHRLTAEQIAVEWIRLTLTTDDNAVRTIESMMLGSWEACINYMTPLGLHHIMQEGFHYGPQPDFANSREDWTSVYYHRADSIGLGYNRSSTGTNFVSQYVPPLRETFDDVQTCPEKYLLWFHHVEWDHPMRSGRNLWDELYYRYHKGVQYVDGMIQTWASLENVIDPDIFSHVSAKLKQHQKDAATWRDTCINYFGSFRKPVQSR